MQTPACGQHDGFEDQQEGPGKTPSGMGQVRDALVRLSRGCPPRKVSYMPARGSVYTWAPRDVPGPLSAKLAVLQLFTGYLRRRRRRGLVSRAEGAGPC